MKRQRFYYFTSFDQTRRFKWVVADGSAKLSGRDHEFQELTLRRESTVKRRNLSRESHGETKEFPLLNRELNLRAKRRIIPYSQDLHYWTKILRDEIYDAGGTFYYNFAHEFVLMKRPQESSSLDSFCRWKKAHVVSSRGTAYLWDEILQVTPKNPGSTRYSQVWTWEERSMNSECGSGQRTLGIENYVWFRKLWRPVSQRRMPRETEKHKQKIFHTKQCWFQMQRRQWKWNERSPLIRHTRNKKVRKVHFVRCMDIRHIQ